MEVTISIRRAVVVDDDVDALYIDTTAENIGGDQDTLLKRLEGSVARDTRVIINFGLSPRRFMTHRSSWLRPE